MLSVLNHRDTALRHHVPAGKKQFPGKGSQTGYPPCAKEIVEMYHEHGKKMGVPDMRKYMKTLVAEIFFEDKYSAVHKCRGIWKQKPSDWADDIPFCDPNNAEHPGENQKKPSRKTLATMMKYLVYKFEESRRTVKKVDPVYKSEESLQTIEKMGALSLGESGQPAQQSYTGKPVMQPSDWQQAQEEGGFVKQEEWNTVQEEKLSDNFSDLLTIPDEWMPPQIEQSNVVAMESEGGQPVQEESNAEGVIDVIDYVIGSEQTPLNNCTNISVIPNASVYEEVGNIPEMNINMQTKNSDMQIVWQSQAPVVQTFAPPQEPPPVKNEVQVPVSNSGHLVMSHTTAAFSGGENQGDDLAAALQLTGDTTFENIDHIQLSDLLKDIDPNLIFVNTSHPMMEDFTQVLTENSNQVMMENSNQVMMENSNQVVMENSNQIMMENINQVIMEDSSHDVVKMEGHVEETMAVQEMSAPAIGSIPTMVLDFDAE